MDRCLYCEEKMPLSRSLAGNRFCTDEHQNEYRQRMERSFLERLNLTKARPADSAAADAAPKPALGRDIALRASWELPAEPAIKSPLAVNSWVRLSLPKRPPLSFPTTATALRQGLREAPWSDIYAPAVETWPDPPASTVPPETFRPPLYALKREFRRRQRGIRLRPCPPKAAWVVHPGTLFPEPILMRLDLVLTPAGGLV